MLGGPTVRRIHREREQKRNRRVPRYAFRRPRREQGQGDRAVPLPPPPPTRFFVPDVYLGRRHEVADDGCRFPLNMADVIGLAPERAVVVVRGQIMDVRRSGPLANRARSSSHGQATWRLAEAGSLQERLEKAVEKAHSSLRRWQARDHNGKGRYRHLDSHGTLPTAAAGEEIERFVHQRLIPRLGNLPALEEVGESPEREGRRSPRRIALQGLEDAFGFVGGLWHELVPFYGSTDIGVTFSFQSDCFTAIRSEPQSKALSRELKRRGMNFVGPTICYAYMQSVGLINDHLTNCFRWKEVQQSK